MGGYRTGSGRSASVQCELSNEGYETEHNVKRDGAIMSKMTLTALPSAVGTAYGGMLWPTGNPFIITGASWSAGSLVLTGQWTTPSSSPWGISPDAWIGHYWDI